MTVGMATIAGAVMAGFAAMGISLKYLITASFMGAPGGLLMAKILEPETDYRDPQLGGVQYSDEAKPVNIFEAAANGAATAQTRSTANAQPGADPPVSDWWKISASAVDGSSLATACIPDGSSSSGMIMPLISNNTM